MASNRLLVQVANLIARVVLRRVDDSKKMQSIQVQVLDGETRNNVERVQNYGFTSVPLPDAEGVAVFINGDRGHGLVVAMDDRRYRPTGLQAGEVAIYTDQGDKVVLERGGTIRVTASTKVVVAAPLVELAGNTRSVSKGEDLAGNADAVALASKVSAQLTALKAAITGAVVVPLDGGASFKASLLAALASWPAPVASAKVKAE